jgi:hypothetical protein
MQYIKNFKTFHLKIPLKKNMFFGKNDPKKDNNPKCKVNTLIHYMSFGPTSRLVYLGTSTILKFYENLSCTNKFNLEGFSIWWNEVNKVLHLTFLVIRGTCCSHESWHLTRMDNNILCLNFYIIKSINEGGWLWGKIKQCFWEFLYKTDIDVNLFKIFSHAIVFFTIKSLVRKNWTFKGLQFFQLEAT